MTAPSDQPLATRLATALGDAYTIEGEVGRGGMGVVYRARDERLQRRVAIKVLPPELAFQSDIRERFTREAQTAAKLSHPHIVPIHTVGEGHGLVYFVMGYVDGESVASRIRRRGKLPVEETRADYTNVSSAAVANGSVFFNDPVQILTAGPAAAWSADWGSWNGKKIYFASQSDDEVDIYLPVGTNAFYLYAHASTLGTINVTATAQNGTTSAQSGSVN